MIEVQTKTQEELILEERKTQRERLEKRARDHHESKRYHIEFVKVKCVAIDTGYYANRIIKTDQVFLYDDVLKNGKFPLWCEPVEPYETSWSKLSSSEKSAYLSKSEHQDSQVDQGLSRELKLLREELERERALRNEAEERLESKTVVEPSPFPSGDNSDII